MKVPLLLYNSSTFTPFKTSESLKLQDFFEFAYAPNATNENISLFGYVLSSGLSAAPHRPANPILQFEHYRLPLTIWDAHSNISKFIQIEMFISKPSSAVDLVVFLDKFLYTDPCRLHVSYGD